jgi:hypothetical protein
MRRHEGSITVRSTVGEGTEFFLRFWSQYYHKLTHEPAIPYWIVFRWDNESFF